jgi:hypothetical protein
MHCAKKTEKKIQKLKRACFSVGTPNFPNCPDYSQYSLLFRNDSQLFHNNLQTNVSELIREQTSSRNEKKRKTREQTNKLIRERSQTISPSHNAGIYRIKSNQIVQQYVFVCWNKRISSRIVRSFETSEQFAKYGQTNKLIRELFANVCKQFANFAGPKFP